MKLSLKDIEKQSGVKNKNYEVKSYGKGYKRL